MQRSGLGDQKLSDSDTPIDIEDIANLLEYREFKRLRSIFKEHEVADIAEVLSEVELEASIALFRLIPRAERSNMFAHLNVDRQKDLLEELPDVIVSALLNEMDPDDRTSLFESLGEDTRDLALLKMSPEERKVAWQLLGYPEGSVGRIMTPDFLTLNVNMSVSHALKFIHWSTALPVEFLSHLFITADDASLIGEVSLATLVVCDPPHTPVASIMKKNHVKLSPYDDAERAVELFRRYDHHYIPVVDEGRRVIGMVTSDDVFGLAEEEATEDIQQFGGHGALEDSYFNTPLFTMLRKRAGALAVLFVSGFLTSEALRSYNDALSQWGFLSFFIPLIMASGGNSGTQAASLIIRGLAINEFRPADSFKILRREIVIGVILGLFLASLWWARAYLMDLSPQITVVVGSTIIGVVIFGVVAGAMLPFLFRLVRLDPAVVSSPFISTLVDVMAILIFLNIAILVFKYFGTS